MIFLRKILFPISILYWLITFLRNWCYDIGLFKSQSYELPIIAVGNLSVGGTGKTPHIEYLIRLLSNYKIATLSRGYKRTSKGFVLADVTSNSALLGDEPFQFYTKFPNVAVAVDADRRHGIAHSQSTNWSRLRRSKTSSTSALPKIQARVPSQVDAGGQAPCSKTA